MNHRLLAIDLDGTLLVGNDLPSAHRDALEGAIERGFRIIIATARWRQMAERIQRLFGSSDLIIACSGAQLFNPKTQTDLVDIRLPGEIAAKMGDIALSSQGFASATTDNETLIYTNSELVAEAPPKPLRRVTAWPDFVRAPPRIMTAQGDDMVAGIKDLLGNQPNHGVLALESLGPKGQVVLTITASSASKGGCLRAACETLGISTHEVIAFGDSEGDLDLFAVAGCAVAMGQSSDRIKQAADYVTKANSEFGIATFLDQYFSGNLDDVKT